MTDYNGWKNYATWNVALWIDNGEGLYEIAKRYRGRGYGDFVNYLSELCLDGKFETPDGIAWNDPSLDIGALDQMISEL